MSFKVPPVNAKLLGSVRPPVDLLGVAQRELGEHFDGFIKRYGPGFTPEQFVSFVTEKRYGSGN